MAVTATSTLMDPRLWSGKIFDGDWINPEGGEITFRVGACVFLIVTVAALLVIARAAWAKEAA